MSLPTTTIYRPESTTAEFLLAKYVQTELARRMCYFGESISRNDGTFRVILRKPVDFDLFTILEIPQVEIIVRLELPQGDSEPEIRWEAGPQEFLNNPRGDGTLDDPPLPTWHSGELAQKYWADRAQ